MLIEDLIRQGGRYWTRGFRAQGHAPIDHRGRGHAGQEFLSARLRGLGADGGQPDAPRPAIQFGEFVRENGKEDSESVDKQAVGAPIVIPSGGNPLQPQGRYLPIYPCYDPHIQAFRESAEGVKQFLTGRLERTVGFPLSGTWSMRSPRSARGKAIDFGDEKKVLGVLILARCEPGGYFTIHRQVRQRSA